MINNKNIGNILKILQKYIKNIQPAIEKISNKYNSSFHILISTLLSARTKDQTTIKVCQNLFKKIKDNQDLIKINKTTLQKLLYPVGFYKIKAKHLKKLSLILEKKFKNHVPDSLDALLTLPGVGKKTANLVLILAFDKYGICVDTHVHRIVNRWQYVHTRTPDDTEQALRKKLPKPYWKTINNILVSYGKIICKPVNPLCQQCKINQYCQYPKKKFSLSS